jgi:hypothetical protein
MTRHKFQRTDILPSSTMDAKNAMPDARIRSKMMMLWECIWWYCTLYVDLMSDILLDRQLNKTA